MAQLFNTIKVALVDDHILLRVGLELLINSFEYCEVIFTAGNGKEVIQKIKNIGEPSVIIMDLNMPIMDGHETSMFLKETYPNIKVLMLTMYDTELAFIRLLKSGVKGFLKKDANPAELQLAIRSVMEIGHYYQDQVTGKLINLFAQPFDEGLNKCELKSNETQFIKLCCTEMTYKQIAEIMKLSPRALDHLRNELCSKLDVKNRIGLAMLALRHGLVRF
jgi:DNA-binding NarL/FixJ family response regulator